MNNTDKYSRLEEKILLLQNMDSDYLTKNGFKLIESKTMKDPEYEPSIKADQPLSRDYLPEYIEEIFELGLIINGKKLIYFRRNRCHDNLASISYMVAGIKPTPIIEVDPDCMGEGGLFVCNDVLDEEEIKKLEIYLNKVNSTEAPQNQTTLQLD